MKDFCLPKKLVESLKQAIETEIVTPKLLMFEPNGTTLRTTESRIEFLSEYTGEGKEGVLMARELNKIIEGKLLNKSWENGVKNALSKITDPADVKRGDIISKIEGMNERGIFSESEQNTFLEGLASKRLGVEVTQSEIKSIISGIKDIQSERTKFEEMAKEFENLPESTSAETRKEKFDAVEEQRIQYGLKQLDLEEYVQEISPNVDPWYYELFALPRTLQAWGEFSAFARQGSMFLTTKHSWRSVPDMLKFFASKEHFRRFKADVITDPDYEHIRRSGLRASVLANKLTQKEEGFMTNFFKNARGGKYSGAANAAQKAYQKTHGFLVGGGIEASDRAYTGFLTMLRVKKFKEMLAVGRLNNQDTRPNSQYVKEIADFVNMATGSANFGPGDSWSSALPLLNAIFYAPRKIVATIQMFNPAYYYKLPPDIRKEALIRLISWTAMWVTINAGVFGATALLGKDDDGIEIDPRSSDFGKIKIGNTRFDIAGGNLNLAVLFFRLVTGKTKSSSTGIVRELGEGYGSTTGDELMLNYFTNKFSPMASLFMTIIKGTDFDGEPVSAKKEFFSRVFPLFAQDVVDVIKDEPGLIPIMSSVMSGLIGVGISTYGSNNKDVYIQEAFDKYGSRGKSQALNDVYKKLEEDDGEKLSDTQKLNIKKSYSLYSSFSGDEKEMRNVLKISDLPTNEEKAEYLKKLKEKDRAMYNEIIKKGRGTVKTASGNDSRILISDALYDML